MGWIEFLVGVLFLTFILTVLVAFTFGDVRSFVSAVVNALYETNDQSGWLRAKDREKKDRKKQVIVDLAHAHDSDDMALAVEIWRGVYEEFGHWDVVGAMDEAEEKREFWFGSKVDGALKESWRRFLEESWIDSRGEFLEIGIAKYRPRPKKFLVEMAYTHRDGDMGRAIELWRGYEPEPFPGFSIEMEHRLVERMMVYAEVRAELWLGSRVDDALKESWSKFVDDSYVASRDDYITNLERGR
ncbi:MAG: hypothetical protein F4W93_10915 [Dehalococcoidia bacterium]|nr:hypothetical protein [Dehalococcoidia bacterium]